MTQLALKSGYTNGVALRHAETTRHMFPGYRVHAITNGVHVGLWTHAAFAQLYGGNWRNRNTNRRFWFVPCDSPTMRCGSAMWRRRLLD